MKGMHIQFYVPRAICSTFTSEDKSPGYIFRAGPPLVLYLLNRSVMFPIFGRAQ